MLPANDRCDQENLHAQLKGGVRALHAPVDNLVSNWAYMVMTVAGLEPESLVGACSARASGHSAERATASEKQRVLRMEFKTFLNALVRLPCQIVRTGRRLIYRLLGWNPWQGVFFRLVDRLTC